MHERKSGEETAYRAVELTRVLAEGTLKLYRPMNVLSLPLDISRSLQVER